jgi:hypothetical protein
MILFNKFSIFLLVLLLTEVLSVADTTVCPPGYSITSAHTCNVVLGPCKTTNYDASVPTYATTCVSCYDDADLFTIYLFSIYVTSCVPKVCMEVPLVYAGRNGMCLNCQTGFTLTANGSCVLNPGILVQSTTTTLTATSANTTNATAPANTTCSS